MFRSISTLDEKVTEVAWKLEDNVDKTEFQADVKHLEEIIQKKADKQELEEVMKEPQIKGAHTVLIGEKTRVVLMKFKVLHKPKNLKQ